MRPQTCSPITKVEGGLLPNTQWNEIISVVAIIFLKSCIFTPYQYAFFENQTITLTFFVYFDCQSKTFKLTRSKQTTNFVKQIQDLQIRNWLQEFHEQDGKLCCITIVQRHLWNSFSNKSSQVFQDCFLKYKRTVKDSRKMDEIYYI